MCVQMYCLSERDVASSGNCRCTRSPDEVCARLNYAVPEPEPEGEGAIDFDALGSADRLVYQTTACLNDDDKAQAGFDCENLGRTPQLYWLFVMMVVYILVATALVRFYRRLRTKKESQFYKAIRDGVVKIDVPDFDSTGGEMDMRMVSRDRTLLKSRPATFCSALSRLLWI
jgi:hypothetical protein